jgi:hypothetical protein
MCGKHVADRSAAAGIGIDENERMGLLHGLSPYWISPRELFAFGPAMPAVTGPDSTDPGFATDR